MFNFAILILIDMGIYELYELYRKHPVVTTDTRNCPVGSLFFALRGANFNGNDFAMKALDAGCAYAVVDDASLPQDNRLLLVGDVLQTLQDLAAHHRRALGIPVLQITGTNGKTTTKELVAAVLSEKYNTLYTQGNLNNHIGVPLTLLRLREDHQFAVIETGANHPGEIAELSRIVGADYGLVTNVGRAHLEGFGSFEGVVRTKSELYDYLRSKKHALAFLHADNPHLTLKAIGLPVFTYGSANANPEIEGEIIECSPMLAFRWRRRGGRWQEVGTRLIGAYNLDNVLAAVAVGIKMGVSSEKISHAISHYIPNNNRSEFKRTERNQLIVDAYNANPTSMRASLENFRQIEHPHKMLILGEMRELGTSSAEEHAQIVRLVSEMECETVWFVGKEFCGWADGFRCFDNVEEVVKELESTPLSGRLILIKGSNGTRLYQLPEFL